MVVRCRVWGLEMRVPGGDGASVVIEARALPTPVLAAHRQVEVPGRHHTFKTR